MTQTEFFKQLAKLKGKYKVNDGGMVRAKNRDTTGYCPIVGVAKLKGYDSEEYESCARFLGLRDSVRDNIVNGADDRLEYSKLYIRRKLLTTLGLEG